MRFKNLFFVLVLLLAVPLSWNALSYLNMDASYGFLRLKQAAITTGWYLPAYYAHVVVAGSILLIGLFQLKTSWSLRWHKLHKVLGRIYVFGILVFSAPGGLIMSFFIGRGPLVLGSFVLQCSAWFFCTLQAYRHIRMGHISLHRQWMWRTFSLTMAAITLRVYVFIGSWSFDLSQPTSYAIIAWLSWVPNLLICEWYIRLDNKRNALQ